MLVIELTFLTGRFHATPWGRHVNEGVPEWPPSPYRLLRALYDAWCRKRPDLSEAQVEKILSLLASQSPFFYLPSARAAHIRTFQSANKPDMADKQLIFDAFVSLAPRSPVYIGWPDAVPDEEIKSGLIGLLSALNYFGRSESWVSARLMMGEEDIQWNCVPSSDKNIPLGKTQKVPVACTISQQRYIEQAFKKAAPKGPKTSNPLSWLDALTLSTKELIQAHYSQPPAMEFVDYHRSVDCFHGYSARSISKRSSTIQGVLYELNSKVLPSVTDTLLIAERFRFILMGTHKRIAGGPDKVSSKFSGKENGTPMSGHRHIYILPQDHDRDGRLDHLAVVCHHPLNEEERIALDQLDRIWQSDGRPDIRCIPIKWGKLHELFQPATRLISTTPFISPRHYRKGRGDLFTWLVSEIYREAAYHGLPKPSRVTPIRHVEFLGRRPIHWIEFRRNRKGDRVRMGYGFILEFDKPLNGPIALGYGAHFGLGQFVPDDV